MKSVVIEGCIVLPGVDRAALAADPNIVAHVEELFWDRVRRLVSRVSEPAAAVFRRCVYKQDGAKSPLVRDMHSSLVALKAEEAELVMIGRDCSVEPPGVIAGVREDGMLHLREVNAVEATFKDACCFGHGNEGGPHAHSSLECLHSL